MYRISLRHNFETAHRLSHEEAPTKCRSIHGHSWWVTLWLEGEEVDEQGMLVEFGRIKRAWRGFLDEQVDHHLAVRHDDPVAAAIEAVMPEARILRLPFDPTTEEMARWLFERARDIVAEACGGAAVRVQKVHLQETRVNGAEYEAAPA